MKDEKPFDQLSPTDQKTAIDIACAASILVTRLPCIKREVMESILSEFAAQYQIPSNLAKYALRQIGVALFESSWQMQITKLPDGVLATSFTQGAKIIINGNDGKN